MKKKSKSLQEIEDFYIRLGYRGNKLREALSKDKEYQNNAPARTQIPKGFALTGR